MKVITKILTLMALTVMLQATAAAHTMMTAVSPENGAVLSQAPQTFTVQYSKAVRLVKLHLTDTNNNKVKLPQPLDKAISTDHSIALPQLSTGQYQLNWILMGKDGHKMKGKLNFTIIDAQE